MKAKLIMSGLAALSVMVFTSAVYAQDAAREAIGERLAPVGQLCLQGQDCGTAASTAAESSGVDGESIYANLCSACHESGAAGAPKRGDQAAWAERTGQGFATLVAHSIDGIGAMPARGGSPNLSDEEMEAATAYMVEPVMDVPELGGNDEPVESEDAETGGEESDSASEEASGEASEAESGGSGLDGAALYTSSGCAVCHNSGIAGAPAMGDSDAWVARLAKGTDELYANAINGIGAMPAKGGNPSLSDEEIKAIVDHMIAEAE